MHQPRLSDYKDEVYNLGSPTPDPKVPIKTIKNATVSKIPTLKVKLNFTPKGDSSRKRSRAAADSDSDDLLESPPKKIKMDQQSIEMIQTMMEAMEKKITANLTANMNTTLQPLQQTMTGIRTDMEKETAARVEMQNKLVAMESTIAEVERKVTAGITPPDVEKIIEDVIPQVTRQVGAAVDSVWKNNLAAIFFMSWLYNLT